ncbi:hypothetical protein COO60DRAFT_712553 [Scenedesmus sp. NREL 46B-D3]|nr:hypothetical protein COO60DRAFT_712553 [Scenedesmus sp. NREL 46B-D3]
MVQQQAASKPGQLAVQNSNNSSSCVFKPISSPGKMESLGLTPVPKVRMRPTSMKKKKPSALDKQYRHVALLQRHNRRQAAQQAQQHAEQRGGGSSLRGSASSCEPTSWQVTARQCSRPGSRLQQEQHCRSSRQQQLSKRGSRAASCRGCAQKGPTPFDRSMQHPTRLCNLAAAASTVLLLMRLAAKAAATGQCRRGQRRQQQQQQRQGQVKVALRRTTVMTWRASWMACCSRRQHRKLAATSAAARPQHLLTTRPAVRLPQQPRHALALQDQQQQQQQQVGPATAADEAAEERQLLQFAEGLSWEQVVWQLDDEQLAAAFQVGAESAKAASAAPAAAEGQACALPCALSC